VNAVILAGGFSRRLSRDKCLLEIKGKPAIARITETLHGLFDAWLLSVGRRTAYPAGPIRTFEDRWPGRGPLGGIHGGLMNSSSEYTFFCACDMPFISREVVRRIIDLAKDCDAVVPRVKGEMEPLLAIYRRSCLPFIERQLQTGENRIIAFFPHVKVRVVEEGVIRAVDPELLSFFNINTQEDLDKALKFAGGNPQGVRNLRKC
jgi:molybdopterin-guanine dinucleotide biosynthesis protein A